MPVPDGAPTEIVSLAQVVTHVFGDQTPTEAQEAELELLLEEAVEHVEELVGAVVPRVVTERASVFSGAALLQHPVISVDAVTDTDLNALTLSDYPVLDDWGRLTALSYPSSVLVTYVAGRMVVPARAKRAVLRWVSWAWAREHGGSESYEPAGEGAVAIGVAGIEKELAAILGGLLRGPVVA